MPQLDKTGPEQKGPKTGRKLGKCKDKEKSDFELGKGLGLKNIQARIVKEKGKE